jgi:glycosyltransferase involved in cell wall biosynthesis
MTLPTLHLVSLPHTQSTPQYLSCAYTQKVVKFGKMMTAQGYKVILYSNDQNETVCSEHVQVKDEAWRAGYFGDGFNTVLTPLSWDVDTPYWKEWNETVIERMRDRLQPKDLILLISGTSMQPIATAFPTHMSVEWGIGYEGTFAPYRIYESHAWRHYVWGKQGVINGRWFDDVIPNFFDREDFAVETEKDDYLMYLGRIVSRKGVQTALDIARRAEKKLILAGPGATEIVLPDGRPALSVPNEGTFVGENFEYVGEVGKAERSRLLSKASALIVPTNYIEPFGGVAVEAMMCGTPVITSDFGAFTETVLNGLTGFRFRTLKEGVDAALRVGELDPEFIAKYAQDRFSLEAVGPMYADYFTRLQTLWCENGDNGWYS